MLRNVVMMFLLASFAQAVSACYCSVSNMQHSIAHADAIFAGTIVDVQTLMRDGKPSFSAKVTFSVSRVWKGAVGQEVSIYVSQSIDTCGFEYSQPSAVGTHLLMYVGQISPTRYLPVQEDGAPWPDGAWVYSTSQCGRHLPQFAAAEDYAALGPFTRLAPLGEEPDRAGFLKLPHIRNNLPAQCADLTYGTRWVTLAAPPDFAPGAMAAVADHIQSWALLPGRMPKYVDYWARNEDGDLAYCRHALDSENTCGEAVLLLQLEQGAWAIVLGGVDQRCAREGPQS